MAKVLPPKEEGLWPNMVAAVALLISPGLRRYVRDLEHFREVHRFD